jgi:hypothetical protein
VRKNFLDRAKYLIRFSYLVLPHRLILPQRHVKFALNSLSHNYEFAETAAPRSRAGVIARSFAADIIAMDPLASIEALRKINFVMKDGKAIARLN